MKIVTFIEEHFKFSLFLLLLLGFSYFIAKDFFTEEKAQKEVVKQEDTKTPININYGGEVSNKVPNIYVNVTPATNESSSGGIREKTESSKEDIVIKDSSPIYRLNYNGKIYEWDSPVEESHKFENGQFYMERTSEINVNVEVPEPKWGIGIGVNKDKDLALSLTYRIGKSPFNIWGYHSKRDSAGGIMFTTYK